MYKCRVSFKNKTNFNSIWLMGFLTLLEFYTMRKIKSAKRPKKTFSPFFFSFCYNSCWGNRILLKFCTSNLDVVFHICCKRLNLFWSVRGLISKMPTYPTCQLAPLSSYILDKEIISAISC
jgi:lipid-A-disaccharide synthase-like uncharacterized protein